MEERLQDYHFAVVATDGLEEPELAGPINLLKRAGIHVDVLAPSKDAVRVFRHHPDGGAEPIEVPVDKKVEEALPDGYDAVLVPGSALDADRIQLEQPAQDFVRSMRQAGKLIVCMPVLGAAAGAHSAARTPPAVTSHRVWSLMKEILARWSDINAPRLGAALAYYTLLSIAPLLVVVIGIAGLAFGREAAQSQIWRDKFETW